MTKQLPEIILIFIHHNNGLKHNDMVQSLNHINRTLKDSFYWCDNIPPSQGQIRYKIAKKEWA